MKRFFTTVVAAAALFVGASAAQAQLTLTLDTANDLLWFTGSDTGSQSGATVIWSETGASLGSTVGSGTITSTLSSDGNLISVSLQEGNSGQIGILLTDIGSAPITLTGLGAGSTYDYSGLALASDLEALVGTTLALNAGSGFSPINVAAIPEPASLALLGLGGLLIAGRNRRKA